MEDLIVRYREDGDLLALLKAVRCRHGGIDRVVTAQLAAALGCRESELYGLTTFYAFLSRGPIGRHVIRVCRCLPCSLKDADAVLGTIRRELGIGLGDTTADGLFTLQAVNCIGACDVAPAMLVNETRYGHLTPQRVVEVLSAYRRTEGR